MRAILIILTIVTYACKDSKIDDLKGPSDQTADTLPSGDHDEQLEKAAGEPSSPLPSPSSDPGVTPQASRCVGGIDHENTCWYLSKLGESCAQACATHDGYNEKTRSLAGDAGDNEHCIAVAQKLGITFPFIQVSAVNNDSGGLGCAYFTKKSNPIDGSVRRITDVATTADKSLNLANYPAYADYDGYYRFCACQN